MKPLVCLLLPVLLLIVGCAAQPRIALENFEEQLLEAIDTEFPQKAVLERFGEPHDKKSKPDGTDVWIYNYLSG